MISKFKIFVLVLASVFAIINLFDSTTHADTFNQNNIINDANFNNVGSMSAQQINGFLNQFSGSCISQNNGFSAPDPTGYSPATGFQYGGNVSAGQVLYDAAQTYGINPQVLIATIQKEQGLVDGTGYYGCTANAFAATAGYGCPDGGSGYSYSGVDLGSINGNEISSVSNTCVNSSLKAGFSQQVIRAAWLLKFGEERSEGNMGWDVQLTNYPEQGDSWNNSDDPQSCYGGPMTQGTWQICPGGSSTYYDGYTTIDGASVYMSNGATAALYWYTPHFNGNQNFFNIYTSWFGYSSTDTYPWQIVQESGGDGSDWLVVGNTKRWIPTASIFADWGFSNYTIQQVSSAYFNSIPTIPQLGRLGLLSNGQYVFVDSGQKYIFNSSSALTDWGQNSSLAAPLNSVLNSIKTAGNISQVVQQNGTSNYYLMSAGTFYPIGSAYINRWQIPNVTIISANTYSLFSSSATTLDYRITAGGQNYFADMGRLLNVTSSIAITAYGSLANNFVSVDPSVVSMFAVYPANPLVQANNSSSWEYLIDSQQHYVLNSNISAAWGSSQPQQISSDLLSELTQGSNLSTVVEATDTGNYYLLDGSKHLIASSLIPDWIGSTSPMQVTESEITVNQGSNINTPIFQINGTPNLYTVIDGKYFYIQTAAILNGYGYPSKYSIFGINPFGISSLIYGGDVGQFLVNGTTTYYLQDGTAYPIASGYENSWTNGSSSVTYSGSDFTQRFNPSSSQLTNHVLDSSPNAWIIDNGQMHNVDPYSDTYFDGSWVNITLKDMPQGVAISSYLARSTNLSNSQVWLINGNTKQWITNIEEFDGYKGRYMPMTFLSDSSLNEIPNATPSADPSIIIKSAGSGGLKLLMNGEYYSFPDSSTLLNVVGSNPITTVPASIYNNISTQAGVITRLIKDSSTQKVYYMQNGQKDWITSASAFNQYSGIPITVLPSEVVNWFPEGSPIN